MSEDLVERYLAELRASLRTPPGKTAQILAEAEDHLRESVAAGRAAGMTERDAQQAAISAFGSVRAVARANHRPPASRAELGLTVLGGCHVAHRIRQRRRLRRGEVPGAFYSLVTAVFCVVLTVLLAVVGRATRLPHDLLPWAVPGALVTTAGYSVRLVGLTLAR